MPTPNPKKFAELLTKGIYSIRAEEEKNLGVIQDELGYLIGKSGGSSIDYWRKGNIPSDLTIVKQLAQAIVERGKLDQEWLKEFLASSGFLEVEIEKTSNDISLGETKRPSNSPSQESSSSSYVVTKSQATTQSQAIGFASMPTNFIPKIAALPLGSYVPIAPNPLFLGRGNDLKQIASTFKQQKTNGLKQIVAITGHGGIGKSQLAIEFAHRYGQYFSGGVFWLNFLDAESVPTEIAACGESSHLALWKTYQDTPLDIKVKLVQRTWQEPIPRLLIFDNCEHEELLNQWRPTTGGCYILITSRRSQWNLSFGVTSIPLTELRREESKSLLSQFVPITSLSIDEDFNKIASILGDLPLALHIAGSFLVRYRNVISPTQYAKQLEDSNPLDHPSLTGHGSTISPTNHEQNIIRVFRLTYNQLEVETQTDKLAESLLIALSYLAPNEPIPLQLLKTLTNNDQDELSFTLLFEDALHRLVNLGIIRQESSQEIRVHGLVAHFIKQMLGTIHIQQTVEKILISEADKARYALQSRQSSHIHTHLQYLVKQAQQREDTFSADLCGRFAYILLGQKDYSRAKSYFLQALQTYSKNNITSSIDVAITLDDLGLLERRLNNFEEAHSYFEQSLAMKIAILGEEHFSIGRTLNNLAYFFQFYKCEWEEAEKMYRRSLAIKKQSHDEKSELSIAITMNNLGRLLTIKGNLQEAKELIEQGLSIKDSLLSDSHSSRAVSLNTLSLWYRESNKLEEAKIYLEQALAIREKRYGANDYGLTFDLDALGVLHSLIGEQTKAQQYLERSLHIRKEKVGQDHTDTAQTLHALGELFLQKQQLKEAQRYLELALAIFENKLPPNHLLIAKSTYQLGLLHKMKGNPEKATTYLQRALQIRETKLGSSHNLTIQTQGQLALL